MKRKLSILFITLMIFVLSASTVFGASMSAGGGTTVAQDGTTTVTFYIDSVTISSGSIELSCSSDLEIVSGAWLLSNTLLTDYSNGKGVATYAKATAVSGAYFQVTVKGKNISKNATVTATAILKNGSTVVGTVSATKTINVICKSHSYGSWSETPATCEANGSKTRTCSVCGMVDTQYIPALGHSLENTTVTKQPTCLDAGEETGKCKTCGKTVTVAVSAKGHSFGPWIVTEESTCQVAGVEQRTCRDCNIVETRAAELKEHDFGTDYEVVREATIAVPGLVRGTCQLCGQTAEQLIPCAFKDEASDIKVEADEGVFQSGTTIEIKELDESLVNEKQILVLSSIAKQYKAFSIRALLNGAEVQPNGTVSVTLSIPEGYGENIAVVYLDDEGNTEFVGFTKNADGTVTATLTHFSTYSLIEIGAPEEPTNIWMYVAIGEAVLVIALAVILVVKGKKKQG